MRRAILLNRLWLLKTPKALESLAITMARHSVSGMMAFLSRLSSELACRFRSRAELELEVIALRHQLAVLRRQRPGRTRLCLADRLLWVWL
jgi:hypothetical protein